MDVSIRVHTIVVQMDIDYAIRKDEPPKITDTNKPDQILLYKRERNLIALAWCILRLRLVLVYVVQSRNVRELLKTIDEQFVTSDKALASTLIMKFTSLKLTSIKSVREHIMEMRDVMA